jgi:hypothetical protein
MAEAWGWSIKRVRTFLDRLEMDSQTTRQTGTLQNIITVCNYETYQSPLSGEGTQTGTQTGTQWARKGHEEEQGNKVTSNIKPPRASRSDEPEGFAEWYSAYPRKVQRDKAAKAYRKAVPAQISITDLLGKTRTFAAAWQSRPKTDLQFCPYPASWLNSGEYKDSPPDGGTAKTAFAPVRDASAFTEADWLVRIQQWRGGTTWPEIYWGPAPGQPGCIVPSNLLVGAVA